MLCLILKRGKMKNKKKAWLRILESVIGILILLSALIYIISTSVPKRDISGMVYEKEKYILEIISKNDSLRSDVIASDNSKVNKFIETLIPSSWGFETKICNIEELCGSDLAPIDRDIYSSEVVISSDINNYNPKKIRLFIWLK